MRSYSHDRGVGSPKSSAPRFHVPETLHLSSPPPPTLQTRKTCELIPLSFPRLPWAASKAAGHWHLSPANPGGWRHDVRALACSDAKQARE
ncbi:hypothetical protein PAPYR_5345 [Paratrimastix pyriformis]|uniref:Uncharacterized protein n=1 Tax=Paratrimastix pyriformis TaxID=342808 RepID=A0ABQ8UM89_9EUKA|nr:hypothetical protein PAPYR_5345 [Paratrimastix pyriformis]